MSEAAAQLPAEDRRSSPPWLIVSKRVLRHYLGATAIVILLVTVVVAIFAPLIAPYDPSYIDYEHFLSPPSADHWFGTDELGRDILSRVIYGTRVSLMIVAVSTALAIVIGSTIGMISGYVGGWLDGLLMRIVDAMLAFPFLVLALAIIAVLGPDLTNAMIALMIAKIPTFARLARAEVLSLRNVEYISAAKAIGVGHVRLIAKHLWPNIVGNLVVFGSLSASQTLITESALSFLGLGVRPPTPSWGYMVAVGMDNWTSWWVSFFPGLAIFVTVLAFNFLGDAVRDAMDVRLGEGS